MEEEISGNITGAATRLYFPVFSEITLVKLGYALESAKKVLYYHQETFIEMQTGFSKIWIWAKKAETSGYGAVSSI